MEYSVGSFQWWYTNSGEDDEGIRGTEVLGVSRGSRGGAGIGEDWNRRLFCSATLLRVSTAVVHGHWAVVEGNKLRMFTLRIRMHAEKA